MLPTFEDDPGVDPNPPLVLIELKAGDDLNTIKTKQQSLGRAFLFQSIIFVKGTDSQIAAFR